MFSHSTETFSCRLSQEQEEDLLAGIQSKKTSNSKPSKPNQSEAASVTSNDTPQSSIPSHIDTNESIAASSTNTDETEKHTFLSSESDLVTSTNRDDEETLSQTADCQSEQNCDKSNLDTLDKSEEPSDFIENDQVFSTVESSDSKFDQEFVASEDPAEESTFDNGILDADFDADDDDDVRERRNAKTCVEREMPQPIEPSNNQRHVNNKNFSNFQRNRNMRGPPPNAILPHPGPNQMGGDNFNPAFGPQFRGGPRRLPGPQQEFFRGHPMMMMRHPPGQMGRMPMMQPNRMPMPAHGMGPPRMQRGPFPPQPNMGFVNNAMPPQGNNQRTHRFVCLANNKNRFSMFRYDATKSSGAKSTPNDAWPITAIPAICTTKPFGEYETSDASKSTFTTTPATNEYDTKPTAATFNACWCAA